MSITPNTRRKFVKQISLGLAAVSLPSSLLALADYGSIDDTFYNYEEALKKPLAVKRLAFCLNNSNHPYTKSLPDARIQTLVNLEELYISGFTGTHMKLPAELKKLEKLRNISINGENLVEIPRLIWDLPSLTNLFFEMNALKETDLKLPALSHLEDLGMKLNKTEKLPVGVFDSPKLKRLFIQSDTLKVIPNLYHKLPALTTLTLHCPYLAKIPDSIGSLSKLNVFDIYNKVAKSLDIDFSQLENLSSFRWGQSLFFPTSLTAAPNLRRLNLDVSFFETINADSLPFKNLETLDMTFSKLKAIPRCFETLAPLKYLYFNYHDLNSIAFDFTRLTNLKILSFRDCSHFDKIDMEQFISSLKTIRGLEVLETPALSKEQSIIRNGYDYKFEWTEARF